VENLTLMLDDLYRHVREMTGGMLSSDLEVFKTERGGDLKKDFTKLLNEIALTRLTSDRQMLAVTGLQGAGKTTIIKRLYEMDERFLPENLSRGEQLPVLISEWDKEETCGFVCRSVEDEEKRIHIETTEITAEEFKKKSMDPKTEDIWLELKVPYRYLKDESKSIALLPGFEKDDQGRSQDLLQHVLHLSTSSITVFRKDTYARQSNTDMMARVQEIYKGMNPIFVLSHGDVNPEQNEGMKQDLMNDFMIPEAEHDRVVISGDSKVYQVPWKEQLISAINQYAYLSEAGEEKRQKLIRSLFRKVQELCNQLDKLLQAQEVKSLQGSGMVAGDSYHLLANFEREYERVLRKLENDIEDSLSSRVEKAHKQMDGFIMKNETVLKGIISKFVASDLKDQIKLREELNRVWKEAEEKEPEEHIVNVVTNYLNDHGGVLTGDAPKSVEASPAGADVIEDLSMDGFDEMDMPIEEGDDLFELEDFGPAEVQVSDAPTVENTSIQRINTFFADRENERLPELKREDLKALTVIGTMLCRQSYLGHSVIQHAVEHSKQDYGMSPVEVDTSVKTMEDLTSKVDQLKSLSPMILKSIPIILGVDASLDGELDILTRATAALSSIGITLSPLQLLGVVGGGIAVAYTANAVQKGVHSTNERQLKLSQAARQVIDQLPKMQAQAFTHSLRKVFENMAERLYEQHQKYLGVFGQDGQLEKLQYSLRKVRVLNNKLIEAEFKHAGYLVQT
jgi:hypothetical protein